MVLFPEHVTIKKKGDQSVEHLYVFRPGNQEERPSWHVTDKSLEYEMNFPYGLHMLARATLEEHGVHFEYTFTNRSDVEFDLVYAVTDPRLTSIFQDVKLERTYVHHQNGFELLASETPERFTMPLEKWLPCKYHASYNWKVPGDKIMKGSDGITKYWKSQRVDYPFIATTSSDEKWVVATFTTQSDLVGNVWSNPELTCQHVDPQGSLLPGETIKLEVNLLILRGSIQEAFSIAFSRMILNKPH
jgi:hypothetical protein